MGDGSLHGMARERPEKGLRKQFRFRVTNARDPTSSSLLSQLVKFYFTFNCFLIIYSRSGNCKLLALPANPNLFYFGNWDFANGPGPCFVRLFVCLTTKRLTLLLGASESRSLISNSSSKKKLCLRLRHRIISRVAPWINFQTSSVDFVVRSGGRLVRRSNGTDLNFLVVCWFVSFYNIS